MHILRLGLAVILSIPSTSMADPSTEVTPSVQDARAHAGTTVRSADRMAALYPERVGSDTPFYTVVVERPSVDVERASGVYDFGPNGRLAGPVTVCLTATRDPGDSACLGYFDERAGDWKCEDECLERNDDGQYCGKTDHFTSFAVLLSGGRGTNGCDDDSGDDVAPTAPPTTATPRQDERTR